MRKREEAQSRRHIWMGDDDWEQLVEHFGDTIGPSAAIRQIVKAFLVKVREEAAKKGKPLPPITPSFLKEPLDDDNGPALSLSPREHPASNT